MDPKEIIQTAKEKAPVACTGALIGALVAIVWVERKNIITKIQEAFKT